MAKYVEDEKDTKRLVYPRPLVMFRPPSRHTYGFQDGDVYDLPLLELQTLLQLPHINFTPVMERNSQSIVSSPLQKQSRNQMKKKKQKKHYDEGIIKSLYWLESSNDGSSNDNYIITKAVSRAILTHALFSIEYSASFSNDDWTSAVKIDGVDGILEGIGEIDVISLSNPNLSNVERAELLKTISTLLRNDENYADDRYHPSTILDEERVLIYHHSSTNDHYIKVGTRMAIGPAGSRGAPSQTLRRTHRGILKKYALKNRLGVGRSEISTAMEPEIGIIMANFVLAGTDTGQSIMDPCCGSGSLLLYASALGATNLVGVDSLECVWKNANDEFRRHTRVIGTNTSKVKLALPRFFHGDVFDPSSTECLQTINEFDALIVDPPYNIGAPIILAGKDIRPLNYHQHNETLHVESAGTVNVAQRDITASILNIARKVLVDGGRLVFFLPVQGDDMHLSLEKLMQTKRWLIQGPDEQLEIQFGRLQRFSPTFARWLVCIKKRQKQQIISLI